MGSKKTSTEDATKKEHRGRTLVLKGRSSKKWGSFALRTSISRKGHGVGTEKKKEVAPVLQRSIGRGVKAWKTVGGSMNTPTLPGVNHMEKIFTRLSRLRKKTMPPAAARTLSRASSTKVPTAQEGPRHFWAAGGDNAAESYLGHIKQTMRRLGFAAEGTRPRKRPSPSKPSRPLRCCAAQGWCMFWNP